MYRPIPALIPVLYIPGMIYRAGVHLRNRAFDAGFASARSLTRPIVSVGNLTLGGTGKTPFVIYLAGLLKEMGHEAAVLTRGYGRRKSGKTIILPPGKGDLAASLTGDEPALIRRRLPEVWLGISSDRFCAANAIMRHEKLATATRLVFILDDGFQRRDICRDLDIVMVDSMQSLDTERLFPLGGLREPAAELRRAHVVIINGTGISGTAGARNSSVDAIMENLRKYAPKAEFFHCIKRIRTILPFSTWLVSEASDHLSIPQSVQPKSAFLAAAIANPGCFKQDILNMGIETPGCAFFSDHALIGKKDWQICVSAARAVKAEAIIITEKDAVKISSPPDFPLLVAVQDTDFPKAARFREILQRSIQKYQ